ncbi:uncharacterized protein LOC142505350 [Primulina tabacum]|uniref:uncharacterized protein LOC142505344 n=1 Tax=Primulina tabacum TaxID=48773 RepID=UPI003F5ACEC0
MRKYARKRGSPRCILKVDLEKAYDTVDWGFLHEVLLALKFPCLFVDWIMECVTTTSYSIVINGHYHGLFYGMRGLRQGFTVGTLPFRYLGIPIAARKLCAADYSDLLDNVNKKVSSWPRNSLSYAGKIELIRSVIQGVECFWLSILPIPACIINSIQSICRKFVWPTKHPPIAWSSLCKPLADGGLGLKDLRSWNRALLAKTLWNIHSKKDSLWIKWVNHIYSCFGGVWSWSSKHDDSPLIKNILLIRDELIRVNGNEEAAIARLQGWFSKSGGIARAYDYFIKAKGKWPWKPILDKSCIIPKHRFVLWLLAHSKLMTRDRLGFLQDRKCVLCAEVDETITHIFFQCKVSKLIWDNVRNWLCMDKTMASPTSILRAFRGIYKGNSLLAKMRVTALAATVYHVWNLRNRIMFDNERIDFDAIGFKIKIHTYRCVPQATIVMS